MGVRIAHDKDMDIAILFCSTTDTAFGPVFSDGEHDHDAQERAEAFLRWIERTDTWHDYDQVGLNVGSRRDRDVRQLTDGALELAYSAWLVQEAEQWAREDREEREKYAWLDE